MHWSFAVFLISVLLAPSVVGSEPSVTCWDYGMEVSFEMSLFPSLDVDRLHLLYPYCTATNTSTHISLFTNLSSCGTTYVETGDSLIFSNVVQQDAEPANGSANDGSGLITREHDFELPFECSYSRKTLLTLQFVPEGRIEIPGAVGFGNFTFTFDVYKSSSYYTPYEDDEYPVEVVLGDYMYLEYSVISTADLVIMAENCKATKGASFYSSPHYTIIENGCSRDTTLVHDYDEYRSYQRFWIKGFRFFNDYDSFYLHCELVACHANSTSRCHQGCLSGSKRKRREVQEKIGSTSDTYVIKRGPLRLIEDKKKAGDTGKQSAAVIGGAAAAGGVALVAVIALAVLFVKYRIARLLLNRNKIGDMYATEEEQAGRQNAYIQEDDMIEKSDAM